MSAPASPATLAPPAPSAHGGAPVSVDAGDLWRRVRGPLAFIGGLVVLALLLSLGAQSNRTGPLEPEDPAPEGARALVEILDRQGGDVTVARSAADAVEAAGPDTVLVVVGSHRLPAGQLADLARTPGDRVLVRPTTLALEALAPGVRVTGRIDGRVLAPECRLPAARAAGTADLGGELYTADGGRACYPDPQGEGHGLVQVGTDHGTATVLGTPEPLTNGRLADEGNAALLLSLVDGRDVVWLRPEPVAESGQADIWDLVPPSLFHSLIPLTAALLLLAFWQGRRLGPLVTERLPVVVRASETAEGRAGLYAARRARDRAGAALRAGTLRRLRPALGLANDAAPEAVVGAVAARTGDDPAALHALLYGAAPSGGADPYTADDHGLVRLGDDLDGLEGRLR
ncbi:DUF4350 domain-containing protein [Streptomonospora nanhaiensis]|uniref:DUF4350 domain-containing protein n=1 Tax=Streptomonospora nanhaiensis TaxID=1323731 RepID=UPI001C99878B|nr:DUF4350 domain-containing protein [Streptomonospora nanhaiensis]MBX9390430.1 DUF4350 domain-containing protein [Streptomonospora nanhaiensis]